MFFPGHDGQTQQEEEGKKKSVAEGMEATLQGKHQSGTFTEEICMAYSGQTSPTCPTQRSPMR